MKNNKTIVDNYAATLLAISAKLIVLTIGLLSFVLTVSAQDAPIMATKKLVVGDTLPPYRLLNLLNYKEKSLKLTDFKGRLLILDFWDLGCRSCIESWPKLIKLQAKFENKIKIITVNPLDPKADVEAFVKKREKSLGIKMNLTMSNGDTILNKVFPFSTVPHVVWIDTNGVVKQISGGAELNEEVISAVVDGQNATINSKIDSVLLPNWSKPLFVQGLPGVPSEGGAVVYSTTIRNYGPKFLGWVEFGFFEGRTFGAIANYAIRDMFAVLFGKEGFGNDPASLRRIVLPASQMEFRGLDTTKLVYQVNGINRLENVHTLHTTIEKKLDIDTLKKIMIAEAENYFELLHFWEKQKKTCLVFSRSQHPLSVSKGGESRYTASEIEIDINNITMKEFLTSLSLGTVKFRAANNKFPIIDETDFQGKLGKIKIKTDVENLVKLNLELENHGLKVTLEDREIDVLVFVHKK